MNDVEVVVVLVGSAFGIVGFVPLVVCGLLSIFIIDKADRYCGVKNLGLFAGGGRGFPFCMTRLFYYGLILLFSCTSYVQDRFGEELEIVEKNAPPRSLRLTLKWLYGMTALCSFVFMFFAIFLIILQGGGWNILLDSLEVSQELLCLAISAAPPGRIACSIGGSVSGGIMGADMGDGGGKWLGNEFFELIYGHSHESR